MQGPPACGYVPTLTNIYPIYGLNRRGEGTSLLSHLAILKGDGQHRTTKIPVSWFTLGSKPPSQLVGAGPVTRHNELKLTTKSPKNKASKPTDNGKRTTKRNTDLRFSPTSHKLNLRSSMRCAPWNVLTLNNNAALPLLSKELNKLNISLAGLQETRLCDSGETLCDGFRYLWSGRTDGKHYAGVGLAMNTKVKKALTSWKAISPRLLSARFLHQSGHLTVIVCYAPTETSDDASKDQFYDDLSVVVNHTSRHDVTISNGRSECLHWI